MIVETYGWGYNMARKNATYRSNKIYKDGLQWTDKLVGKSAMKKYMMKMLDILDNDDAEVTGLLITCTGKDEDDIKMKEEINYRTFKNVREQDEPKEEYEGEELKGVFS